MSKFHFLLEKTGGSRYNRLVTKIAKAKNANTHINEEDPIMKKTLKTLALVMALVMMFSCLGVNAFAAGSIITA